MKKFWMVFVAAFVAIMMITTPAIAKEPRTHTASATAEKDVWKNYIGESVVTKHGHTICLRETQDGYCIKFVADPEGLGQYEGVHCVDCHVYYYLDGMNNAIWDEFVRS